MSILFGLARRLPLICVLLILGSAHAAEEPQAIRIAGDTTFVDGEMRLSRIAAVIRDQGWLEAELAKRGIKLEWFATSHAATGPQINEAFASHQLEFASYGDLPSIILNASGVKTRIVVPNGVAGMDGFLVVPMNSTATSIEDLKGKRIAIHKGRPWEISLTRLLDSKHLTYDDFQIYNINPQAGAAAVATGAVDALFTTIDAYMLDERGMGKIIWSTKDLPSEAKTRTELWASADFIAQHPELTQLVVTAYVKAEAWSAQAENREAVLQTIIRAGSYPESVVRRNYDDSIPWAQRWSPVITPVLHAHYREMVAYALDKKMVRHPLDSETLFDDRFDIEALKELGLQDFWGQGPAVASGQ